MKISKKIIIGLSIIILTIAVGYYLLIRLAEFNEHNVYLDIPQASADGKSFYIRRLLCSDYYYNPSKDNKLTASYYNFESCFKPGKFLSKEIIQKDGFFFGSADCVKNGELYLSRNLENTSANRSAEFTYFPGNGPPLTKFPPFKIEYDINPTNIIFCDQKTGFFHYDPLTDKVTKLCPLPDVRNDVLDYLHSIAQYKNVKKVQFDTNTLTAAGDKPESFIAEFYFTTDTGSRHAIYYFYDTNSKKLINPAKLPGWNHELIRHLRFTNYKCDYAYYKSSKVSIIDTINVKNAFTTNHYDYSLYTFSPDTGYMARLDARKKEIWLTDLKTGTTKLFFNENRDEASIEELFWFPAENKIITTTILDTKISNNNKAFTEIAALDPMTGVKTVISPPCPFYTKQNDKFFTTMCKISDKTKPIADKIDKFLGLR